MHGKNALIGDQLHGECVKAGHVAADDKGGTENAPKGEHGALLIVGEFGAVALPLGLADGADGQHIRVRPVAGTCMGAPFFRPLKHGVQQRPIVPEVVGNAPHVGGLLVKLRLFQQRRAGGKAEHHIPAAVL